MGRDIKRLIIKVQKNVYHPNQGFSTLILGADLLLTFNLTLGPLKYRWQAPQKSWKLWFTLLYWPQGPSCKVIWSHILISKQKKCWMNHHTGTVSGWRLQQVVEGRTSSAAFVTALTGRLVHVRLLAGRTLSSRRSHIRHGCCHFTDFTDFFRKKSDSQTSLK